jgi:WD40 repeat protein/tetratricopeptide (TPR) repeat protein
VTGNLIGEPLRYERDKRARDAEFSPDGSRIAIFSEDQVRVWDASTGKALGEPLKQGNAFGVRFSPDGARILTFGGDYTARIWDVSTGRLLGEPLCHDHYVHSAEFSRDGARVITSSEDKTARIWDSFTGKPLGEPLRHEMGVKNAQFSPDGTRIVTADGALTERVWDAVSCRTIISFKIVENILDESSEMGHFSPDGTRFLSVRKSSAQVWDVFTGKLIGKPIKQVGLRSARFSPDGSRVVTASSSDHLNTLEEVARVWDASSGRPLSEALPLEGRTRVVQFSADCKRILALGHNGCLRTWDVVGGNVAGIPLRHKNKLTSGRFSSDGTRVVTASLDKTARIWDVATGQLVGVPLQHEERVVYAEFSPDGTRVVTTSWDKTARIWDVATGKPLGTALQHNGVVSIAKFSPDGMRVVTASWDKTARIWDAATGQNVGVPLQHEGRVGHAEFSPDGTRVVTASWDKTARIWDVATGKPLGAALQHNSVVSLAEFSPDGTRVVTASEDKTARIWDASTGKPVGDPLLHGERFSNAEILSAQFSCDSTRIVTSTRMGVVQVWDARTGSKIGDKVQHEGALHAQFSRDSDLVVTVSHEYGPFNSDRAVRFWNAATGKQESEPLRHDTGMISVEFSPDDSRLLSVSEDDTAWIQSAPVRLSSLPSPVPTWILRRSQAIAGLEFSEDGELVAMPNEARRSILLEETPGDDAWAKLARWLVMPSDKRTLTPNSPVTVRLIAERERDSGTRKGLESALRYNPTVPLAHVLLAGVLAEEDAKKNAEERDPSIPHRVGFLRYCGLRLLPEDAALQSRAAESLVKQGVYKGALSAVGKALALEPKNLAALRAQSSAFSGLKRNEEALAAYRAVLEAGGVDEGDFSAPAYLAAKMQRQSDAKFFLAAGRAKLPGSVPFARMEGWSLINLGDEAGAVAAFRRGESLVGAGEKPDEDLLAGLALSLWLNQQRDEAVAAYIRLIESREDRAWATPEKIAGTGWPEAERVPLESLRIETLRRHPEWNPKPTDAAK